VYFLENGPFSSHAPQYDSSYTNLPKEETDILLTTYGDETAYQYALSLLEFSKGTTSAYGKYVNLVLNTTTNGEHEKYVQFKAKKEKLKLENKDEQQKQQQQTIEHKNEATNINNEIKNEQNDTIQSTNKSQEN
jgi:bromodomain-containing protein 7/9